MLRATASHVASSSSEAPGGTADGMLPPPMHRRRHHPMRSGSHGQSGDEDDSVFDLNESGD